MIVWKLPEAISRSIAERRHTELPTSWELCAPLGSAKQPRSGDGVSSNLRVSLNEALAVQAEDASTIGMEGRRNGVLRCMRVLPSVACGKCSFTGRVKEDIDIPLVL